MTDKIINTFQQRRHLADAIKAMADLASARELILAARSIARTYPAPLLTSAVLNELDTENGHIRGGLGHICSLMPADEIGPALQAVVSDRRRSAHARITAANILERNLGRQAPAASMQDLVNTNDVALQSLREAIEVSHHNPHVLLDYVTQMRATEAEIAFMVLELLHQFSIADQLPLLQLIAQDDRPEVAVAAIERLDQLVTSDADDPAHRALHTLQFVSAPPIDQQVKRMLRKHQFSGRRLRLPAPEGWRALISPIDGAGRQLIWFLHTTVQMPNDGTILVFALNLHTGIESFNVARALPAAHLPATRSRGEVFVVYGADQQPFTFLEAPFDVGRWLVSAAAVRKQPASLPDSYKLHHDLLWQFEEPQLAAEITQLLTPANALPLPGEEVLTASAGNLLKQPTMAAARVNTLLHAPLAQLVARNGSLDLDIEVERGHIAALIDQIDTPDLRTAIAAAYRQQAAWYALADDAQNAQRAALLAASVAAQKLSENALITLLVRNSLAILNKPK